MSQSKKQIINLLSQKMDEKGITLPKEERVAFIEEFVDVAIEELAPEYTPVAYQCYNYLPYGVAVLRRDNIVYANPAFKHILGLDKNEAETKIEQYLPQDSRSNWDKIVSQLWNAEIKEKEFTQKIIHARGHVILSRINLRANRNKAGDIKTLLISVIPLNPLNQTHVNNEQLDRLYQSVIANAFTAIAIHKINWEDNKVTKAKAVASNEMMNHLRQEVPHLESIEAFWSYMIKSGQVNEKQLLDYVEELKRNKEVQFKFKFKTNKDRKLYLEGLFKLIEVDGEQFLVTILIDQTEIKEQEITIQQQLQSLQKRQQQLETYIESNLQLENFAYIASHDLKAPLRTVLSFSQLLKRFAYDKLNDREKEFLDIINQSTNNMMLLIRDLLVFSSVNTNKVEIEEINIESLKSSILIDLKSTIEAKDARVEWDINVPTFYADKVKMMQLFENLINNALKFVEEDKKPHIVISHRKTDEGYDQFSIKDNGIGIDEENYKKIFGIFEKLHSKDSFEGTGLGLSICAKIVEQHHGEIWVESQLGQGSTFYFTINGKAVAQVNKNNVKELKTST